MKLDLDLFAFHIRNCERFLDQAENTVLKKQCAVFCINPYLRSPETVASTDSPILKRVFSYLTAISGIIPHINTYGKMNS
jgi:hypothetical protein